MKFSGQTVYDKERLLRFGSFFVLRKRGFWCLIIVCTVFVTICAAFALALNFESSLMWFGIALVWLVDITCIFCYFVLPRFTINKEPGLNANILFEFYEDFFKISGTSKNGTESSESNYSSIIKIMESKQDVYLFISRQQAFILDKSGFTMGNPEELINFLKDKNIPYKK